MPNDHKDQAEKAQMKRGRTERETCELNGWSVGTRLVGDEGHGPTVIRLTHFTEDGSLLAITESRKGKPTNEREHFWTLAHREWTEVPPEPKPEPAVTLREVARAIGWLDAMNDDLEFNGADWAHIDDDGVVSLEGRKGDLLVWATVEIKEVSWEHDWSDDDYWTTDDEDEDDD